MSSTVIDLVEALNSGHDENGEPVYPDQETSDLINLAMTRVGHMVVLHDLACCCAHNGECLPGCVEMGIKQTDAWDEETTPE